MSLTVQAISSHPVLVLDVEEILARLKEYPYLPSVRDEREATSQSKFPRLFLLDACSLHEDMGPLTKRCRASSPGSKFISLLSPADSNDAYKIWLLHHGIDGFVELSETWKIELPQAIRSVLGGQCWVRPQILAAFRKHTQVLEQARVLGKSLTDREKQILRLLMQHL